MIKRCEYCGTLNAFNKTEYCKSCDRRLTDITPDNKAEQTIKQNQNAKTVIDCNIDKGTTIERLLSMTEISSATDKSGKALSFFCRKDGKFMVKSAEYEQDIYVSGEIFEQDGKTKVLIEEIKNTAYKFSSYIYLTVILLFNLIYLLCRIFITDYRFTMIDLIILIFGTYSAINQMLSIKKKKETADEDLLIMKGEVIRRIRAAEKWDD